MTKKILITLIMLAVLSAKSDLALAPQSVYAKTVCVQLYSGAVECREEEPVLGKKHEPVEADLGDVSPALLAGGLLTSAGVLLYLSRRAKISSSFEIR